VSAYDFTHLSEQQQKLLTYHGWRHGDTFQQQPSQKTAQRLLERGLMLPREILRGSMRWTEYDVPDEVHAAWVEFCTQQDMML